MQGSARDANTPICATWTNNLRRLRIRYGRSADLRSAFMQLGCAVICQRMLTWPLTSYPSEPTRPY